MDADLRRVDGARVTMSIGVLVVAVIVIYPLSRLVVTSLSRDSSFTLLNFAAALSDRLFLRTLRNSLVISVASTAIATAVGTALAWVVVRTDLPAKRLFRAAFLLPFLMPPFLGALAWKQLLGPVGLLNDVWQAVTGSDEILWNLYGADGIITVLSIHHYPLVFLSVSAALSRMNPELEEAAQISGSHPFAVMRRITLPLMLPAISTGAVLVFTSSIANFGIPAILGFPDNYYVLTTRIFELVTRSAQPYMLSIAAALSILLGLVATSGLLAQKLLLKQGDFTVLSGKSMQPNTVGLRGHRTWIVPLLVLFALATNVAPIVSILLTALTRAYGLAPVPANWTLANFYDVLFVNRVTRRAITNSFLLAASSATIIALLGAIVAYITVRTRLRGRHALDVAASLPYALPGTVVAIAMILAWLRPIPVIGLRLYNTIWILLVAYVARYLAYGIRSVSASLSQVHPSLEEAARVSGSGWFRVFRTVLLPLVMPGIIAGWFLVFMPALRELTISALLWSSRNETIGVMVFNLQESGNVVAGAALGVVMMAFIFIVNLGVRVASKGRIGL